MVLVLWGLQEDLAGPGRGREAGWGRGERTFLKPQLRALLSGLGNFLPCNT